MNPLEGISGNNGLLKAENSPEAINWSFETLLRIRPPNKKFINRKGQGFHSPQLINYNCSKGESRKQMKNKGECDIINFMIPDGADPGLLHNNPLGYISFNFNEIFNENSTQEQLFNKIQSKALDVFTGINSTILAYGQTGSGKTYSMCGGATFEERGLIPRTISLIFTEKIARSEHSHYKYSCFMSFLEIYGDTVYDLLIEPQKRYIPLEEWGKVQVQESEEGVVLRNLNVFEVQTEEDALNLFFMGTTNRLTSSTVMNHASSRSHAIFTIIVEGQRERGGYDAGNRIFTCGKINLVDLAGSERVHKVSNSRSTIKEGQNINLSLHFLEQVIITLREQHQNSKPKEYHIPYRNSVLTNILRDSLGGNCKSYFLLTLSPEIEFFDETISTCRFGQRCGEVRVKIHANEEIDANDQIRNLKQQLKILENHVLSLEEEKTKLINSNNIKLEQIIRQSDPERSLSGTEKEIVSKVLSTLCMQPCDETNDISTEISPELMIDIKTLPKPALLDVIFKMQRKTNEQLASYGVQIHQQNDEITKLRDEISNLMDEYKKLQISLQEHEVPKIDPKVELDINRQILVSGWYMFKRGSFNVKKRFVFLSPDFTSLCWVHDKNNRNDPHLLPLGNISRVEASLITKSSKGSTGWVMYLISPTFNVEFEFCQADDVSHPSISTTESEREMVLLWVNVLNGIIKDKHI